MNAWSRQLFGLLALFLLCLTVGGCRKEETSRPEYGRRTPQQVVGAELFKRHCSHCHGDKGSGGHMTAPLRSHNFSFGGSQADIMRTIRKGLPQGMPAFGGSLSEEQIEALAAYIRWLQ